MDVDIEEGEIVDHHDSQMISQLISEADDDDIAVPQSKYSQCDYPLKIYLKSRGKVLIKCLKKGTERSVK